MIVHYTSCTRFGNKNAIVELNRPFASVEDMDAEIIRRWNEKVGENDTVWHLGDFGDFTKVKQLNGKVNIMLSEADVERLRERDDYDEDNSEEYIEYYLQQLGFNEVYLEGESVGLEVNEASIPERYRGYTVSHETPEEPCIGGGHRVFAVVGETVSGKNGENCILSAATDLWNLTPMDEGEMMIYFLDLEDLV